MRVLAVDDDPTSRLIVHAIVTKLGHECLLAADAVEAWQVLERGGIDVVITDRMMPRIDGLDLCRRIREQLTTTYIYVILATGLGDREQALEGMEAGADDYLVKPIHRHDLQLRLIAADRVTALHRLNEQQKQELRVVARRDLLTGLGNRLRLHEDLETLSARVVRYGHQYSLALLDVDYFKAYNDTYGHQAGDAALQSVGRVLAHVGRSGDACYRFGGEEFLCVFPEQSAEGASTAVQRLLDEVRLLGIVHAGSPGHGVLTLSAGVAQMTTGCTEPDAVLRQADEALYRAKAAGRNAVRVADPVVRVGV